MAERVWSSAATSDLITGIENLVGGSGADFFTGSTGANALAGGGGADSLGGNAGNDVLDGGEGDDILLGGSGQDRLTGGGGGDSFVFAVASHSSVAASDVILDFEGAGAPGGDLIDLGALSVAPLLFIGSAAFAGGASNQVRITDDGTDTFIWIDTNTDTAAEARIRVVGLHALSEADFIL